MDVSAATIIINGTVGVGKTTAASALGRLLEENGVAHAVIDTDEIRRSWPAPPGDRFNLELQLANLAALSANDPWRTRRQSQGRRMTAASRVRPLTSALDQVPQVRMAETGTAEP